MMREHFLLMLAAYSFSTVGALAIPQAEEKAKYDREPELIRSVDAEYPKEAEKAKVEGEVILKILVQIDGSTTVVEVVEALEHGCTEAAIEAAQQWKWKPAQKDGHPVEADGVISMEFSLSKKKRK